MSQTPMTSIGRTLEGATFMFRSRGVVSGMTRVGHLIHRFGIGSSGQIRCLDHYVSILAKHDVPATLFVPARVLAIHEKPLRRLQTERVEIGLHALVHTDLSALSPERRREQIGRASDVFRALGIGARGFRAPYLRAGSGTLGILDAAGFAHDSSGSVLWDEVYPVGAPSYEWTMRFYRPRLHSQARSLPIQTGRVVSIPTSLPDDDTLVDRDGQRPAGVYAIWERMLDLAHQRNELFVLQLHPERVIELGAVLEALIVRAQRSRPSMWITTLGALAERFRNDPEGCIPPACRGALCITGDLDAVALTDFADRLRCW